MKTKRRRRPFPRLVRSNWESRTYRTRKFLGGPVYIMNEIMEWRLAPLTIRVATWFAN